MLFEDLGLLFFTVLILSLLLTPLSISFAHYIGAVDHPVGRSVHAKAVPRLGGLAMALAMLAGLLLFSEQGPVLHGFLAGFVMIALTGLADDVWNIKARWKMLGQIVAALLFIEISGVTMDAFGDLFHLGEISLSPIAAYAVTVFLIFSGINCFNFSDGLDGLVSGVVAIMCLFIAVLAISAQSIIIILLLVALLAAVLGFLKFNSFPAQLFMGDCGSLMLGYTICTIAVSLTVVDVEHMIKPVTLGVIVAMPIIDTFWVMVRRMVQRINPARADNTHLHHRLLALGLPHSLVVSILYIWTALFGFLALFVKDMPEYWQAGSALLLSLLFYALLTACEKKVIRFPSAILFSEKDEQAGREKLVKLMGHSMRLFPYVIVTGLSIPLFFADAFAPDVGMMMIALALLMAIAFPWKEHQQRSSIVYGLYYLSVFVVLWVWNSSSYALLNLDMYMIAFASLLMVWSVLKIKFKSHNEVFLTSSFELLLIFISWFIPYIALPALDVSVALIETAKLSCLGAIPLFIALKITLKDRPHRNKKMAIGLILLFSLIAVRSLV